MGLRAFWRFLNRPLLLSKGAKRQIGLESKEYRELGDTLRASYTQGEKAIMKGASLGLEVNRLAKIVRELEEGRGTLEEALERGRKLMEEGRVLHDLSKIGVLRVNAEHRVVGVNKRVCDYLDRDEEELDGVALSEVLSTAPGLEPYLKFFTSQSKRVKHVGETIPERLFKIGDEEFNVQGFYDVGEQGEYLNGYLLITPINALKHSRRKCVVAPIGRLTKDGLTKVLEPLMREVRTKVVDLGTSSADEPILAQLATYYACFKTKRFIFQNVSQFEKEYLIGAGVSEKDIISIRVRKQADESGEYSPIVNPNPSGV